jgi:LacI family repressor for deo operon, udp, cdd, tsx, nupC, and nupG
MKCVGGKMSTIQDVARQAGVSVATVSRVLNDSSSVSSDTRDRVMRVMTDMDYQPNLLGRNLRCRTANMVLVLLPKISNPFFSSIVKGIEEIAHQNRFNILLCNTTLKKKGKGCMLTCLRIVLLMELYF